MKRSFREAEIDNMSMANCLMLLSQGRDQMVSFPSFEAIKSSSSNINSSSRVFECKTCNRQFPSFQALGGHRASHKKPRLMNGDLGSLETQSSSPAKPKTHECSICGLEFAIGQALGGHMRRHRAAMNNNNDSSSSTTTTSSTELVVKPAPVMKKSNSKRVLCLDLNLTPYENEVEFFTLGKPTPIYT